MYGIIKLLGSSMTMLRMKYGEPDSLAFAERVTQEMAVVGWEAGVYLAEEKGPAPILVENFSVSAEMLAKRPEMKRDGYKWAIRSRARCCSPSTAVTCRSSAKT